MSTAEEILAELRRATDAAFDLAESLTAASIPDGDQWTRLPRDGERSNGESRSGLKALIRDGYVRKKTVGGRAYYSAGDLRDYLSR